ncbi:hypothetical protein [Solimicrobium silvestre]|uniref:Uncharacterized protein n=1 Tax=Solimicrobium silvestre TaxID=2099400 RepID=A0A2S9H2X5_9BURK|nr:hypothetical protein [Solimicrobium silvestre]PRC94331.1 hypothetical protein S2091_0952 [Solimicrobium silvestre]
MNRDDVEKVGQAALASIELLAADWFPNGVREGREWCIGSREGEAGRSMKICLSGESAGVWKDFSADDTCGDFISLYAYIFRVEEAEAMKALACEP